jgi:hypothetical protein
MAHSEATRMQLHGTLVDQQLEAFSASGHAHLELPLTHCAPQHAIVHRRVAERGWTVASRRGDNNSRQLLVAKEPDAFDALVLAGAVAIEGAVLAGESFYVGGPPVGCEPGERGTRRVGRCPCDLEKVSTCEYCFVHPAEGACSMHKLFVSDPSVSPPFQFKTAERSAVNDAPVHAVRRSFHAAPTRLPPTTPPP